MIYEYRMYEAVQGKLPKVVDMMERTVPIFKRLGVKVVGFWTPVIGEYSDRFIYILGFESLEHRQQSWAKFAADPDWQKASAEFKKDGPVTVRSMNTILKPTSYSPVQ